MQSQKFQTEATQDPTRARIEREIKRLTGNLRRSGSKTDRADAALGISILALATQQTEPSKAQVLLNLLKDLDL